jgi:hypothetical protein
MFCAAVAIIERAMGPVKEPSSSSSIKVFNFPVDVYCPHVCSSDGLLKGPSYLFIFNKGLF